MQALVNPRFGIPFPTAAWFDADAAPVAVPGGLRCTHVNIGELRVGARTDQLQALLGSCVGIAFLWKKRGRCALAHCLLPESPLPQNELGARYVSQAVPSLLRLIGACEADYADIEVVVAGGGNMLDACSARFQIGQQNIDAAEKYLRHYGLRVSRMDVGGKTGRTLTVDCATQQVRVTALEKPQQRQRVVHHA
ncbi:MAG: chemotaxis protein CheD [Duganella sp.]